MDPTTAVELSLAGGLFLSVGLLHRQLRRTERKLDQLTTKETETMASIQQLRDAVDAMTAKVGELETVTEGMEVVLSHNTQTLRDILNSGAAPDEIVAQITAAVEVMEATKAKVVAETTRNTIAEDEPAPTPETPTE